MSSIVLRRASKAVFLVALGAALAVALGLVGSPLLQRARAAKPAAQYVVESDPGPSTAGAHIVHATCDDGDQVIGGGFKGVVDETTVIENSVPNATISNTFFGRWTVNYRINAGADTVAAVAVCGDKKPLHVS